MLIFGYPFIDHLPFYEIICFEDLDKTPSNSIAVFNYNPKLLKKCETNGIKTALKIETIKELLFCNALKSDFVITKKSFSDVAQKIANEYLFDTKIIQIVRDDNELEDAAQRGIDGVIRIDCIKKVG